MILTTNHARPINASPIPACFNILNHSLYFSSFPAAVTMLNPPYNNMIKAISPSIPSTQFMKLLITFNKLSPCNPVPPGTSIPTCCCVVVKFCACVGATVANQNPNSASAVTISTLRLNVFMLLMYKTDKNVIYTTSV